MGEGAWDDQHLVNMAPNEFLEKVIPREILEWSVKYSLEDAMKKFFEMRLEGFMKKKLEAKRTCGRITAHHFLKRRKLFPLLTSKKISFLSKKKWAGIRLLVWRLKYVISDPKTCDRFPFPEWISPGLNILLIKTKKESLEEFMEEPLF